MLERIYTEEPLEDDEVKCKNVSDMSPLEVHEEVKWEPEETAAETVKLFLRKRKRKNTETGLKTLTPNKLLTRIPIFLKLGSNS